MDSCSAAPMTGPEMVNQSPPRAGFLTLPLKPEIAVQEENASRRRTDSWHFEKRLSLDTLVGIVGVAVVLGLPIFYWGQAIDGRVAKLEIREDQRGKQDTARDLDARDQRIAVLSKMEKLDEQVTQLRIELGGVIAAARRASQPAH